MRIPHPRFTTRRLMALTVAVALALGIRALLLAERLREEYRDREAWHAAQVENSMEFERLIRMELDYFSVLHSYNTNMDGYYTPEQRQRRRERAEVEAMAEKEMLVAEAAAFARLVAYHSDLRAKYRRAAERPWEWVAPDPLTPPFPPPRPKAPPVKLPPGFGIQAVR